MSAAHDPIDRASHHLERAQSVLDQAQRVLSAAEKARDVVERPRRAVEIGTVVALGALVLGVVAIGLARQRL